jgi:hypothetical protein
LQQLLGTQNSDFIRAILGQLGISPVGGGQSPSDPNVPKG